MLLAFFSTVPSSYAVDLKLGETFHHEDLDLYFHEVEDSRCPLDVICIWEGQVTAMILVQNHTHKILGNFTPGFSMSYIVPYNVTLIDVQPHPVTTEKPDYVAILEISKISDLSCKSDPVPSEGWLDDCKWEQIIESPLKQFKNKTPYHEIKCKTGLQLTQKYDGNPACVRPDTVFELIKRGWVSDIIKAVQSRDLSSEIKDAKSSYMNKIVPTIEDFKNALHETSDIDTIFFKFGPPRSDIGSGIHIYVYDLNDSTQIWIGYADKILYVSHVDLDGNILEKLPVLET